MILGKHTLDETRDLLAIADYRFSQTGKAYAALNPKPDDITTDWTNLMARWTVASGQVRSDLLKIAASTFGAPASVVATEPQFQTILSFIQFQENVKGSLQDITYRIGKLQGFPVDYSQQPQPGDGFDVDSWVYPKADSATKEIDKQKEAAQQAVADSKYTYIIGGSILGTLLAIVAIRKL